MSSLQERIVERSRADSWESARLEWVLTSIYFADPGDPGTCLCGHHPIIEMCELENRWSGDVTTVGNCCVKRFMGLSSEQVFRGMRQIWRDRSKSMNSDAIEFAFDNRWISEWEHWFYTNVWRKRRLSLKQTAVKERINEKVLARMADVADKARFRGRAERG